MIITNVKIEVTEQMMFNHKLSYMLIRGELGIPETPTERGNVTWKKLYDLTDEDFDKIEEYFINKTKQPWKH